MDNIQNSPCGKTSPALLPATEEKTSGASSKPLRGCATQAVQYLDLRAESGLTQERSWATDTPSPGGYWTRNTGECPSVARESTLWQILQEDAPEKYSLSALACAGILRRAERRGKALPQMLREALEKAVRLSD